MVTCKASVRFKRFTPALMTILNALYAADLRKLAGQPDDLVITSVNDSTHGEHSKHYEDAAMDIRSKSFSPQTKELFRASVEAALGPKFRVLFEGRETANEHFHAQFRKGETFP